MYNDPADDGPGSNLPARRADRREVTSYREMGETSPLWEEDSGLDWRRLLYALWRKKWWVAAATTLGILAGVYLSGRIDPVYETRASLWLETSNQERGPIQSQDVFEGRGWAELFQSLVVLEPVVREFKLYLRPADPADRGELFQDFQIQDDPVPGTYRVIRTRDGSLQLTSGEDSVVQTVDSNGVVGEPAGFRWSPPSDALPEPGDAVRFTLTTVPAAAVDLRSRISVLFDPRAGNLMGTRLEGANPELMASVHNALLDSFMEEAYSLKSQKQREVVEILEEQTDYASERLQEAELALENFRVETVTLPQDRERSTPAAGLQMTRDPVFDAFFQKKLQTSELRTTVQQLEELRRRAREGEISPIAMQAIPAVNQASSLSSAISDLVELRSRRSSLLESYTEQHPTVQDLTSRIQRLQNETIPSRLDNLIQQKRSELASVEGEIENQAAELREIPPRSIEEARLEREVRMAEELHNNLLVRLNEAELAASTSLPDLQVVDRAHAPSTPTSNDGIRIFLMASLAGLGLGLGGVLVYDRLDGRLRYPDEVSSGLGLPILGVVPNLNELKPGRVSDDARIVEAFRSVRTQLDRVSPRDGTVLITSPAPKEGKSLISANLAIAYASTQRRVLLIDGDTRRGNVHEALDCEPEPGLTECLKGEATLDDTVQACPDVQDLYLLAHGSRRRFSPELLDSPAMEKLMSEARGRFDLVILDTPPLVAGSDAMVLSEYAEKVLLVLRAGASEGELTEAQLEIADRFGVPVVGALLNDVSEYAPYYKYYAYEYYGEVEVLPSAS